jgi:hypothetical protein
MTSGFRSALSSETIMEAFSTHQDPTGVLYRAGSSTLFIHKVDHAPSLGFRADVLRSTPASGAGQVFPVAKLFGQVLTFSRGGWFGFRERWRRLTPSGFEDIEGGDIGLSDPGTFPYGRIDDLTMTVFEPSMSGETAGFASLRTGNC